MPTVPRALFAAILIPGDYFMPAFASSSRKRSTTGCGVSWICAHQPRQVGAAEPVGVEPDALGIGEILLVLHRGFERRLQRRDAVRRYLRRHHQRPRHREFQRVEAQHRAVRLGRRQLDHGRHVLERGQPLGAVLQQDAHLVVAHPVGLVDREVGETGIVALHLAAFGGDVDLVLALIAGDDLHPGAEQRVDQERQDRIVGRAAWSRPSGWCCS